MDLSNYPITKLLIDGTNQSWTLTLEQGASLCLEIADDNNPYKSDFDVIPNGVSFAWDETYRDILFYNEIVSNIWVTGDSI